MRGLAAMLAVAALFVLRAEMAAAQSPPRPTSGSDLVNAIGACRQIADATRRLACFDDASARLTQAVGRNDVVVVDREDMRRTRRSLFGFHLPRIALFGGGDHEVEDTPSEITATVASVRSLGFDKWQLRLEDGAIWQTTESSAYISAPHAGSSVVIRSGPMGSYLMRIDNQRAVRAMRTS